MKAKLRFVGLSLGVAFGFVLGWARLTEYDTIHQMLRLEDSYVFLLMGSGVATAFVGVRVLRALKLRAVLDGRPLTWAVMAPRREHVIGSAIFGTGWALAGTCPGPIAAQLGRGQFMALFTVAGLLAGVWLAERSRDRAQAKSSVPIAAMGPCALPAPPAAQG